MNTLFIFPSFPSPLKLLSHIHAIFFFSNYYYKKEKHCDFGSDPSFNSWALSLAQRDQGHHENMAHRIKAHGGSWRLKWQSQNLCGSELGPLHIYYDCVAWWFCGTLNSGTVDVSDFLSILRGLFLLLGCLVQHWLKFMSNCIEICYAVFGCR